MPDIFDEIISIYDAAAENAEAVITDHQRKIARETAVSAIAYLEPSPNIGTADWMDEHVYLAPGTTTQPGKWHTSRRPFLRGIMETFDDPFYDVISIPKASRMGITMILLGRMGRNAHLDPDAIMYVQQTLGEIKKFDGRIFRPFVRNTPILSDIFPPEKSRDSKNTIFEKEIPGGFVSFVGANVASGFRMVYVRDLNLDDVDGYPWSVGKEGDPVMNAIGRTTGVWNRKIILVSKPTIKGFSRIWMSYEQSDMRLYNVPCPHCDHGQPLRFGGKDLPFGLKWQHDDPYSAYYLCEQCSGVIRDNDKEHMLARGLWVPTVTPKNPRHAGFGGLSHLYHPDVLFSAIAKNFLAAGKNTELLQVFFNDELGECFEDTGEGLSENTLFNRREDWTPGVLPEGIACLTGDADVGENHIACGIEGWGKGMENWKVNYQLFEGDTLQTEIWGLLKKYVLETWKHYCGLQMRPIIFGIDTRYRGEMVAAFIKEMKGCGINIIGHQGVGEGKGRKDSRVIKAGEIISGNIPSKKNKHKIAAYTINDDKAKLAVLGRLRVLVPGQGGYVHFPKEEWCDINYFEQLLSERKVSKRDRFGAIVSEWIQKPGVRNEPLDVAKGNLSMLIWMQKHKWRPVKVGDVMMDHLDYLAYMMAQRVEIEKGRRMESGELPANEYFMERARKAIETEQLQRRTGRRVLSKGVES